MYLGIAVPIIGILTARAYAHKSLTNGGIAACIVTGLVHAYHPWNLPFALLCVFYLLGNRATKVKHEVKATLTLQSQGSPGGEAPRTHVQVFANSLVASVLSVLHAYQLNKREEDLLDPQAAAPQGHLCYNWPGDLLIVGIIANYAVVTADTLGSELGILSKTEPRLITSFMRRKVPRGTNGGVTLVGLAAGFLGSMAVVGTAMFFLPICSTKTNSPWTLYNRGLFMWGLSFWGLLGSLVDSLLGALLQQTVADARTGKVIEGQGGVRVPVVGEQPNSSEKSSADESSTEDKYDPKNKHRTSTHGTGKPSRVTVTGFDILDNNDVNFLMALMMSIGAIGVAAWIWDTPLASILTL
ncbi:hypothetical protein BROUX41_000205 [Berkeleyomyces rouxiae]|uniref:uncharacterized protein n=1 Tax=Berkeleyomyces rouxiae TaxID=2035830 RepID=UPI003B80F9EB